MERRHFILGTLALLAPFAPLRARAEHLLDPDEAARILFPQADGFADASVDLDRDAAREIRRRSGMRVRQRHIRSFEASGPAGPLGWVYIDDVVGKHEFITYAAGIDRGGAVRGIEILDYRETWGGEVREAAWRAQFTGLTESDPVRLEQDIRNVSGATLSCRNITDGVRRLLATHAVIGR